VLQPSIDYVAQTEEQMAPAAKSTIFSVEISEFHSLYLFAEYFFVWH
jgi:hypothetical protein